MTKLELILWKTPENCPPRQLAGRAETKSEICSGAKNLLWGVGQKEIFCALAAARKIFLKKDKIFLLYRIATNP
jgi:hypothetical protein